MCSRITRPSPPSVNFGCDCLKAIRHKWFLQTNLLHELCMSFSFFFGREKAFARWVNLGTMNLLKNCAHCRTVSLRVEAPHKLLLTLVFNWFKFIVIVSLTDVLVLSHKELVIYMAPTLAGDFHARQFLFESFLKQRLDVQKHRCRRGTLVRIPFRKRKHSHL